MRKLRKSLFGIGILLSLVFGLNTNISAEYVDNETPQVEAVEDEFLEDDYIPKSRLRATLTIPKEGVYDTIKDTKNSKGVMTARSFYLKGKLVEKRTYTQTGSTDCRMKNKYLYYSNGNTVYIHRTYSNTKATCYNLQTKRYSTASKIQAHSIYEGKVNGKVIESRYYDASGTYYTSKAFYRAGTGVLYKRDYWKGAAPNRVTHTANYNTKGDEWINATYYHYPTDVKKEYITYTGTSGANKRKTAVGYDEDGIKEWYKQYNASGQLYHMTYYDEDGYKTVETEIYPNEQVRQWEITYQEGSNLKDTIEYKDRNNKIVEKQYFSENGMNLVSKETYANGIISHDLMYENGQLVEDSKYLQDGSEYEYTLKYNNILGESILDSRIEYGEKGNVKKEIIYKESKVSEINYYDVEGNLFKNETYDNDENLISTKNIEINYEQIAKDKGDLEKELKEKDEQINSYVDISNKIEYNEKSIEKLVTNEYGVENSSEVATIVNNITSNIDEINNSIESGEVILYKNGEIVENTPEALSRANKNGGPKFYWWGWRMWYANSRANKVANANIKDGRILKKGGGTTAAIARFVARYGGHPGVRAAAIAVGAGSAYIGYKMEQTGYKMKLANKGNKKGLIVDLNWALTGKAYRQK